MVKCLGHGVLTIFITGYNNPEMDREDIEKIVLSTVRTMDSIRKVREFMFADIEKCLGVVPAPNFLIALGLCCYTEYWGKLLNMTEDEYKKQKPSPKISYPTKCFNDFFGKLGPCYLELLKSRWMALKVTLIQAGCGLKDRTPQRLHPLLHLL